jgi:hypothetical protein
MRKFSILCEFGDKLAPFTIYIEEPVLAGYHPLHFQAEWLLKQCGGVIPTNVMEAIADLHELSIKDGVSFEELCVYALGTEEEQAALAAEIAAEEKGLGSCNES